MHFEPLTQTHATLLLDFETENRAFFEQLIAPRGAGFFSPSGIRQHIRSVLDDKDLSAHVLLHDGAIVARANIRHIHSQHKAEIGYRVAGTATGKGLGSMCVSHLVEQAKQLKLPHLNAYVMDNNPASEKVLIKNGFQLVLCLPNEYRHQGRSLHGFQYHLNLV